MKVLFYTSAPFLDIAIEMIDILKNDVELHVLIEVTPATAGRAEIERLPDNKTFINPSEIINKESYKHLESYFNGCASVNFAVHSSESGFSFSTLKVLYRTWKYIKKIKPDVIHTEAITLRSLGLFPFIFSRTKIFLTLHDSIPHSGENNWKMILPRLLYLTLSYPKNYFFYSEFSRIQFEQYYKNDKHPKFVMRMHPYTFYKKYTAGSNDKKHILYFGSHSPYKGINVLLEAMPSVFKDFPDGTLIIAGQRKEGYDINEGIIEQYRDNITLLDKYIPNDELVSLIQSSKFVVCPYLDATQSGVLMTANALNAPVIASNVGAFPEYIDQYITGILVPVNDAGELALAIKKALKGDFYKTMEENLLIKNSSDTWSSNKSVLLNSYSS